MLTTGPRGTRDILPDASGYWQHIEAVARRICRLHAYQEIRTPVFEHTELFLRGIGETTDIVSKEMYTFTDRGGRSLTLRPENTAAVVRSYLEHKLHAGPQPAKLYYIAPMFRYDRPQAGRFRQFHQFGIEAVGSKGPAIDAETILVAVEFLQALGIADLRLLLNSVGCPNCRPAYRESLQEHLRSSLSELCGDCRDRFDRNPMRILDCKVPHCGELSAGAPQMADCLCGECRSHFSRLQELLTAAGVGFELDPRLVRGLDYYTKTAFEIQYPPLGSQSAVCGGGRYDGLVAECGGDPTPGIGFAIGLERVLLALEKQNLLPSLTAGIDVFVVHTGSACEAPAFRLLRSLRGEGLAADMDFLGRSMKSQMKHAGKYPARYAAIVGEDEAAAGTVTVRDMAAGAQRTVPESAVAAIVRDGLEVE